MFQLILAGSAVLTSELKSEFHIADLTLITDQKMLGFCSRQARHTAVIIQMKTFLHKPQKQWMSSTSIIHSCVPLWQCNYPHKCCRCHFCCSYGCQYTKSQQTELAVHSQRQGWLRMSNLHVKWPVSRWLPTEFLFSQGSPTCWAFQRHAQNCLWEIQTWHPQYSQPQSPKWKKLNGKCENFKCPQGHKDYCLQYILYNQPDSVAQKSALEELCEA